MSKFKKIQIILFAILLIAIGTFLYLMYSWNYAYSQGTFVSDDGTYTGEFKGNTFEGHGIFKSNLGVTYEGQWNKGEMEGYGIMTFANGSKYEGEFKCGMFSGKGKMTLQDSTTREGVWKEGKLIDEGN
jgi:hypothetical protein